MKSVRIAGRNTRRMQLRNNFPDLVRYLFLDIWECWMCGQNGVNCGGLELHHIKGRESNSAMNASVVCGKCHSHMGHSFEEEKQLMQRTIRYLCRINYQFNEKDVAFFAQYKKYYD